MENFWGTVSLKDLNHIVTVVFKIITYLQYFPLYNSSNCSQFMIVEINNNLKKSTDWSPLSLNGGLFNICDFNRNHAFSNVIRCNLFYFLFIMCISLITSCLLDCLLAWLSTTVGLKPWPNGVAIDASWKLGPTCDSVWPGFACTCVDLRWLALTLVEIKFACKSKQLFHRFATQPKLSDVH